MSVPVSAADYAPPTDGSTGYTASRWASERILERSTTELGVPSSVYRFLPALTQTEESDAQPKMQAQVLQEFMRCAEVTGTIPDITGWTGRLDVLPAEAVAARLCDSLLVDKDIPGRTQFEHLESTVSISGVQLVRYLEAQTGGRHDLEKLPILKWIGKIKRAGFAYFMASHEARLEKSVGGQESVKLQMRR